MRAGRRSTRRRLLAGAAAATAVGAGAAWADRSGEAARVWHHFAGGCAGPDGPVPPAPEDAPVTGRFRSRHVPDDDVGFMVWQPCGLSAFGGLPVVVVLPGRGSTARTGFDELHLHAFLAAELARHGAAAGLAAVDGGESYWHARTDGEDRMAMLETEFLPLLEREFGLGRRGRVVAGWSMGGYGALLLGARLGPERTAAICAVSPALWTSSDATLPGAFDGADDYAANSVWGLPALGEIPIRIDCGNEDPFREATQQYIAELPVRPAGGFSPGGHDGFFWRSQLPGEIAWLVPLLVA